ncbi:MAG: high-potential iron-sulfur protein [Gammaproteobacteria bacterium]
MDEHDKQRRRILHGMLTAGCATAVPILFVGCERQEVQPPDTLTTGDASSRSSSDMTVADAGAAENIGAGKMSQVQSRYQDYPQGNQQCGNCSNFIDKDNTCKVVQGQVSPQGWCTLWIKLA